MPWAPHPGWHDVLGRGLSWLPWHWQHASSIAFQSADVWPPVWQYYPAALDIPHTAEKDRMQVSTRNRNDHVTPTLTSRVKKINGRKICSEQSKYGEKVTLDDVENCNLMVENPLISQLSDCTLVQCDCVHVNTCGSRNVKGINVSVCGGE